MNEKLTISNRSNGQFLVGFYFLFHNVSRLCYQLLTPGNLQSALTEGDRRHLPVASHSISSLCQSKQLTSLCIARWQTVVLLLSTLRITMATANLCSWLPVFLCPPGFGCHIRCGTHESHGLPKQGKLSFSVMITVEYRRGTLLAPPDCSLIVHYVLTAVRQI